MLSAMLAIALQATNTQCTPLGGTVFCNSQPTPGSVAPITITPVDIPGVVRRVEEGRAIGPTPAQEYADYDKVVDVPEPAQQGVTPGTIGVPTARELYIGCSLLLQNADVPPLADGQPPRMSAAMCSLMSEAAIARMATDTPDNLRFCLPVDLRDRPRQMAIAYVEAYDTYGAQVMGTANGPTTYGVVMARRWPCRSSGG